MKTKTLLAAAVLTLNFGLYALNCFAQVIAGGKFFSLALCSDGTVQSWGEDTNGELGDDAALADQPTPVAVATLTGITAVAAGYEHALALKNDGTVWAWGGDGVGQLGNNATFGDNQHTPVAVATLTGIIAIAAGSYHSLALKNDGTVWAWGYDFSGQLGNNATFGDDQPTPVAVATLTGITAISAGGSHSLALKNDGTVWAWGSDGVGQLGNNAALVNQPTPVAVATLTGIIAIAAGGAHSLALKNDGTVWAWGYDNSGQLGNNAALANQPTPVAVATLTGIIAIAAGDYHSLALKNDGTVWAWGDDFVGQLGNNAALVNQPTPVAVATLTGITAIAGGHQHSLAVKNDGTVWSWGSDSRGQLGDDVSLSGKPTPVQAITGACTAPLPIQLLSFTGSCVAQNSILCNWTTATETNNDYFTVERSADGVSWEAAGTVKGAGNSSSTRSYEFVDKITSQYSSQYYRLKQTDFDGKTETFNNKQVAVDVTECAVQVFPNPTGNTLNVPYVAEQDGEVTLEVYDVIGKLVKDKSVTATKGNNKFTLDLSTVAGGVYILSIKAKTITKHYQKFVKE